MAEILKRLQHKQKKIATQKKKIATQKRLQHKQKRLPLFHRECNLMLVQQLRPVQSSVQNLPGGAESGVGSNLGAAAAVLLDCAAAAVLLDCTAAAVLLQYC